MMRLFLLSDRGLTTQHAEPALKSRVRLRHVSDYNVVRYANFEEGHPFEERCFEWDISHCIYWVKIHRNVEF